MAAANASGGADIASGRFHVLGYPEPALAFTEALPLGNGRLGAMCFGGAGRDLIRLNDGTAWSGSPASELFAEPQDAARNAEELRKARQLIRDGRYSAAEQCLAGMSQPYTQSYLPFADLVITAGQGAVQPDRGTYRRALDLRTGIHTHSYRMRGNRVTQQVFVSAVRGVLVVEVEADHPMHLAVELQSQLRIHGSAGSAGTHGLQLLLPSDVAPAHAGPGAGVTYGGPALAGAVVLCWEHDGGESATTDSGLSAGGVTRARICLATDTTFAALGVQPRGSAAEAYERAEARAREALSAGSETPRAEHLAAHGSLYGRAALSLGPSAASSPQVAASPGGAVSPGGAASPAVADADVTALIGNRDAAPQLAALLFNYGRYLLLCSSRPGSLPATLQGLWNEDMQPPWSSNYTLNINTEMNYWGAGPANLAECFEPFLELAAALARTGRPQRQGSTAFRAGSSITTPTRGLFPPRRRRRGLVLLAAGSGLAVHATCRTSAVRHLH